MRILVKKQSTVFFKVNRLYAYLEHRYTFASSQSIRSFFLS